jgi:hypothetical protein
MRDRAAVTGAPTVDGEAVTPELWRIVDAQAPPERLAMLRILTGAFAVAYLTIRLPVFVQLAERESGFEGVGVASVLTGPVPDWMLFASIGAIFVAGLAYTVGWQYHWSAPVFAVGWLALGSYRGSWGQLLHFENLFVLHLLVVGLAPAADRWSLDARAGRRRVDREPTSYGWPIALAALVVVITYLIAGIAKLRYGGLDWITGDTLRNHVAYAAARLDLLGGDASPFAAAGVRLSWVWPFAAAAAIAIELSAPIALAGGKVRTVWVIAAWLLHAGVLALMMIGFPYPLLLVAFAPFFRIERLWTDRPAWMLRARRQARARTRVSASVRPHASARSASSGSR